MILKFGQAISMEEVLDRIANADGTEIDAIIQAVRSRYSLLFPDWEVLFISLHAKPEAERRQDAQLLIDFLKQNYLC